MDTEKGLGKCLCDDKNFQFCWLQNFMKEMEVKNCDKSPGNGLSNVLADKAVAVDGQVRKVS